MKVARTETKDDMLTEEQVLMSLLDHLHISLSGGGVRERSDGKHSNGINDMSSLLAVTRGTWETSQRYKYMNTLKKLTENNNPWTPSLAELNRINFTRIFVRNGYFSFGDESGNQMKLERHPTMADAVKIRGLPLSQTGPGWLDPDRYFKNGSIDDLKNALRRPNQYRLVDLDEQEVEVVIRRDLGEIVRVTVYIWVWKHRFPIKITLAESELKLIFDNMWVIIEDDSIIRAYLLNHEEENNHNKNILFDRIDIGNLVKIISAPSDTEDEKNTLKNYINKIYKKRPSASP